MAFVDTQAECSLKNSQPEEQRTTTIEGCLNLDVSSHVVEGSAVVGCLKEGLFGGSLALVMEQETSENCARNVEVITSRS